jgi:hypothetical protein
MVGFVDNAQIGTNASFACKSAEKSFAGKIEFELTVNVSFTCVLMSITVFINVKCSIC